MFKSLRIPQVLDRRVSVADLPVSYRSRIAMIGCGPASISCATYLARLGYSDITIFEKLEYVGGLRYTQMMPFCQKLLTTLCCFHVTKLID